MSQEEEIGLRRLRCGVSKCECALLCFAEVAHDNSGPAKTAERTTESTETTERTTESTETTEQTTVPTDPQLLISEPDTSDPGDTGDTGEQNVAIIKE